MNWKRYFACMFGLCGIASLLLGLNRPSKLENPSAPRDARANVARTRAAARGTPSAYSLPMTFEPNVGQADAQIQFVGRGKGMAVLLTSEGVSLDAGPRGQGSASGGAVTMRLVSDQVRPKRRRHRRLTFGRATCEGLFVSQRDHGIDAHCSSRGDITREESHSGQHDGDGDEC
jgi:hypothetical protein